MAKRKLVAPFPYFGGKSSVARMVWERFGNVDNYVEPFCGSAAVLLTRPGGASGVETINDIDAYISNFWRAVAREPEAVAREMDWPINECDLEARHKWLVTAVRKREHAERMRDDPDYYDVRIAAWWCWGLCAWIGRGWCGGEWYGRNSPASHGCGINIRDPERGGKLPHLGPGMGVHRSTVATTDALVERRLSDRLRRVRVCCGDWKRVLVPSSTTIRGTTAVFLDPPYSADAKRDNDIYRCESTSVAHEVREWAIANGHNPKLRIALCGYEGEHTMPSNWTCVAWRTAGGMAKINKRRDSAGKANRFRERVWFSPHCKSFQGLLD